LLTNRNLNKNLEGKKTRKLHVLNSAFSPRLWNGKEDLYLKTKERLMRRGMLSGRFFPPSSTCSLGSYNRTECKRKL